MFAKETIVSKKIVPFILSCAVCLISCSSNDLDSYSFVPRKNVIWKNYNGEIIQRAHYSSLSSEPSFVGSVPQRQKTPQYSYVFDKWILSESSDENTTIFVASYEAVLNHYTVTWHNYDGTILEIDSNVPFGTVPSYDGEIPTRNKDAQYTYSFSGWSPSIKNVDADIIYSAQYSTNLNYYNVTLDPNGGELGQTDFLIGYGHSYSLPDPTRNGYLFDGWYDGSINISGNGTWLYSTDKVLIAHWSPIAYSITYNLNSGINSPSNPSTYTIESSFSFAPPTRTGYTFLGWFDNNDNQITSIELGTTGNLILNARWSANLNILNIESEDLSKGSVEIISGSGYSDEQITIAATPMGDYVFKGWYSLSILVSESATYSFVMPANDYSLVARFFTKEEAEEELARKINHGIVPKISDDGATITYGLYPQANVSDSSLLSALNALNAPEANGWYLYEDQYYAKVNATPYHSGIKFNNGTTIVSGTAYWFYCRPIKWNILNNDDGKYYLFSSILLDAHRYDGKVNNYKSSEIREWLNGDFYNSAFFLDNDNILTTIVDNSASTTISPDNKWACENTNDKVFLPSYQDFINGSYGFSTSTAMSETRTRKTTDWARAVGAKDYSFSSYIPYWTRSPSTSSYASASCINSDGSFYGGPIGYKHVGVCPSIILKIV